MDASEGRKNLASYQASYLRQVIPEVPITSFLGATESDPSASGFLEIGWDVKSLPAEKLHPFPVYYKSDGT